MNQTSWCCEVYSELLDSKSNHSVLNNLLIGRADIAHICHKIAFAKRQKAASMAYLNMRRMVVHQTIRHPDEIPFAAAIQGGEVLQIAAYQSIFYSEAMVPALSLNAWEGHIRMRR